MKATEDFKELANLLYAEALEFLDKISEELKHETIYAFAIHSISSWQGIYIAVATHESLARLNKKYTEPELDEYNSYNSVNVNEWEYTGLQLEILTPANELINQINDRLSYYAYEKLDGMDDESNDFANKLYMNVVIQVVTKLKESGCFNRPGFDKDLFFGPFILDCDDDDLSLMKQVSKQINSEHWHEKLKAFCDYAAE
jgi:hypothetical protein